MFARIRRLGIYLLVVLLPLFIVLTVPPAQHAKAAGLVHVTYTITRLKQLQCDEGALVPCPNDFFATVSIDGQPAERFDWCDNCDTDFQPNWVFQRDVDPSHDPVSIHVEIWDRDDSSGDDQLDTANGGNELDLTMGLNTCMFQGGGLTPEQGAGTRVTGESHGSGLDSVQIFFKVGSTGCTDTDADGIPDAVELAGFGPGLAADPCRKTIALEIDWMAGAADGHNHRPTDAAIADVTAAFANAPTSPTTPCPYPGYPKPVNASNANGIQLLVDRSNSIPEQATLELDSDQYKQIRTDNFTPGRRPWFHWVLFIHDQKAGSGTSGVCCSDTKDLLVSLGEWENTCVGPGANGTLETPKAGDDAVNGNVIQNGPNLKCDTAILAGSDDQQIAAVGAGAAVSQVGNFRDQAGSIMHELGHSLGLGHGGIDGVNYKPNYLSVMNYSFDPGGIPDPTLAANNVDTNNDDVINNLDGKFRLDYSRKALPALTETALSEGNGLGDSTVTDLTQWTDANYKVQTGPGGGAINWNGNTVPGYITPIIDPGTVNVNLNFNGQAPDGQCIGPGANGKLDTTKAGDDIVVGSSIFNGADHACNTRPKAGSDDTQVPTANDGCVGWGGDRTKNTNTAGDDIVVNDKDGNPAYIGFGPNMICDSTAVGDDAQIIPVGRSEPGPLVGFDDWSNIKFRAALSVDAGGIDTGHPDDITFPTVLAQRVILAALLQPDLKPTKTVDKTDATPGDTLNYSVDIANVGTGYSIDLHVTDTLPDGTQVARTVGDIGAGGSRSEAFTYLVPCATTDLTVLTNSATVTAKNLLGNPETNTSNNTATASTTVHAPVMTLAKTASSTANAGEAITFRLTYANTGSGGATNVVVTDTLPADVYYSLALDLGAGPKPTTVTRNSDGTTTLVWSIGAVGASSATSTIEFSARTTLLALGGTSFPDNATLDYTGLNGCVYPTVKASAATAITVVPPTRNPGTIGFWKNHSELWTAEILARIQATDQRYDLDGNGALSATEAATMFNAGGTPPNVLAQQLLADYFNLATRRINAGTLIDSKRDQRLGLDNVREASIYAQLTLGMPLTSATSGRYNDAINVLDEVNSNKSELY